VPSVAPGYYATGVQGSRNARAQCGLGTYCDGSGIARPCPAGRYGDVAGLTNDSCSGSCANGVLCPLQTTSAAGQPCPAGGYCISGVAQPCPSGTYNPSTGAGNVTQCLLCPAGTFNAGTGASSVVECSPCPDREGSNPGAASCWPGILGAWCSVGGCPAGLDCLQLAALGSSLKRPLYQAECVLVIAIQPHLSFLSFPDPPPFMPAILASDPEPVSPGLSPDDVLTIYWTKATNRPDVTTTVRVSTMLSFSPSLAGVLRASWQAPDDLVPGAGDRLVITLSGTMNADVVATVVPAIRVTVLPGGGLRDASSTSQNASIANVSVSGTWGDASQPQFLSNTPAAIALDYGGQPGLGPGDAVLLRFNQPVAQIPVGTKADLDAVRIAMTVRRACIAGSLRRVTH
jgi:hypothetical protein